MRPSMQKHPDSQTKSCFASALAKLSHVLWFFGIHSHQSSSSLQVSEIIMKYFNTVKVIQKNLIKLNQLTAIIQTQETSFTESIRATFMDIRVYNYVIIQDCNNKNIY